MARPDDHIRAYLRKRNLFDTFEKRSHRLGSYYHSSEDGSKGATDEIAMAARHFCLGQRSSMLGQYGGSTQRSRMYGGNTNLLKVDGAGEFALSEIDVDKICAVARPSPFGDLVEGLDRVDAEVREAFEIPAESFRFVDPVRRAIVDVPWRLQYGMMIFSAAGRDDIERQIATTLFTRDTELEIVPYKLNLYPKGGHFRPHVDTPKHPERLVASLVVQLPTPFEGGALVVRHNGISERMEAGGMQWMAFYPDCQHEVERVTDGNRVTITYHVLAKDPAQAAAARPEVRREAATAVLAGMIQEPIGFLLTHVYTQAAVERGILRGIDAKLRSYLETALPGSKTEIVPVMAHLSATLPCEGPPTRDEEGIYLADASALDPDSHEPRDDGPKMPSDLQFVSCLARPIGVRMRRNYERPIEYTGNDSQYGHVDYLYFNTALTVTPAAESSGAHKHSATAAAGGVVPNEDDYDYEEGHTFEAVSARDMISRSSGE